LELELLAQLARFIVESSLSGIMTAAPKEIESSWMGLMIGIMRCNNLTASIVFYLSLSTINYPETGALNRRIWSQVFARDLLKQIM